jgi:hypothetical protein
MAVPLTGATLRCGTAPAVDFSPSGQSGDWQTFVIAFNPPMANQADGQIRVVVNAGDAGVDLQDHQAVPVPVTGEISHLGFTAWVRNSDVSGGSSGIAWLAVAEVPEAAPVAPRLRAGNVQPQHFQVDGYRGDWRRWSVSFGQKVAFDAPPVVLTTATNNNVRVHAASAVGISCGVTKDGFNLAARNSDIAAGAASFNYVAIQQSAGGSDIFQLDSGHLTARLFSAEDQLGDWQVWAVNFAEPFLVPPVVLVSADDCGGTLNSYTRAVVGVVFDVSQDGFTLAGRNSDVCAGPAGFNWVAVGIPLNR